MDTVTGYFGIERLPELKEHLVKHVANDGRCFSMEIEKNEFSLWISKYKECKPGEHTKLPFDFPYNKAVYNCHNYVKEGNLWRMID